MSGETREREFCHSYWKRVGVKTLQREVEGKSRPALRSSQSRMMARPGNTIGACRDQCLHAPVALL